MNWLWPNILLVVLATSLPACSQKPPNILFIMADDMGWNDVSFHGSDQIQTPNIDTLASKGVVLQQYYSEAICTPARTALLTGKYPMRLGMQGFPLYNSEDRGIPVTERLLPSYLKELGYSTHLVGKWHVGMARDEYLPTNRGYDSHYGMRGGFIDYYTYNKVEAWPDGRLFYGLDLFDNDVPQNMEQRYIVDVLTERAIDVIDQHNMSQPLFLHVTHNAPHAGNDGGALQPPLNKTVSNMHVAHSDRRLYADLVDSLDNSVGRLVKALADKDILDDTIIVFASDNGAPTVGDFRNWGVNLPFRGKKSTPWEGAVRVPAFIWHSSFKPKVWEGLMHITDWLPTLLVAAGSYIDREIDGISQWDSFVNDAPSTRREVLIGIDDSETAPYAAYRAGDYKIIVGNITGLSNGYYGGELLAVKGQPPNYYNKLRNCIAVKALTSIGIRLDVAEVEAMRQATTVRQLDLARDTTPCLPTLVQGCLYNVRKDPAESHNLWSRAGKIALLLTSRLRALWAAQSRRGKLALDVAADPANYNYTWMPWIKDVNYDEEEYFEINNYNSLLTDSKPGESTATHNYNSLLTDNKQGESTATHNYNSLLTDNKPGESTATHNYNSLLTDNKQGESTATHNLLYPQISNNKGSTVASPVNCNETVGIRHFLCILRSVF